MVARTPRSETGQQTAAKTARKRKTEGKPSARRTRTARRTAEQVFEGLAVSPGVAIGPAHMRESGDIQVPEYEIAQNQVEAEQKRFDAAVVKAVRQLTKLKA